MTMKFKVYPPLYLFTQIDPNNFMSLDIADKSSFTYDQQTDVFSVIFTYSVDINEQNIKLTLSGSTQTDDRFYATDASEWNISLKPNEDFPSLYYSDEQYTYSQAIFYLSYVLAILALLSFVLGIFAPNRLSSLEAIFVVQYAFISLIWFPKSLTLPFYCLINLKYSTAYNYPFQ